MKNNLFLLLILQAFLISAQAPTHSWVKGIGSTTSDVGNAIATDASGNVFTTGYFTGSADFDPGAATMSLTSSGNNDVFVIKLNASGNFVWAINIGGTGNDAGNGITTDAAGNVFITGYFNGTVDFNPAAGTNTLVSTGGNDIFILKLDPSGNFLWVKQMGGAATDDGKAIAVDASGNIYTTGLFSANGDFNPGAAANSLTSSGGFDIFVSKLDASGNYVWAKQMGGPSNDIGHAIAFDGSGNIFTTGFFSGTADFDPGSATSSLTTLGAGDIFVSKLDASGNFSWAKQMGGTANDVGQGIAVDASGNVYSGGYYFNGGDFDPGAATYSLTSNGVGDIFVSKLDASGNFLWAKGMGSPFDDFAHALAIDGSGNVYTTGFFADTADFDPGIGTYTLVSVFPANPSLIRDQTFISKLDASGNFVWAGAMGSIKGYGIVASSTTIYTAGFFTSTTDFDPSASVANLTTLGTDDIYIHKMNQGSVGITENEIISDFIIYPNPGKNYFMVKTKNDEAVNVVNIYDVNGRLVFSQKENTSTIHHNLNSGLYFVEVKAGDEVLRNKVVVE
ncbi:MAG: hypothetical protein K0S32_4010 [Bacteroidetes bacterium]|jgi:hypothetical protein|nr:hypothetical protein [Bacteroidota bacterium]